MPLEPWNDQIDPGTIPDEVLASERGRRNARKRKSYTPGVWVKHNPDFPSCRCAACIQKRADRPGQEMRTKRARTAATKRWEKAGSTPADRSAHTRATGAHRPRHQERCPCGAMSLTTAQARADANGKGLGHKVKCPFYRGRLRAPKSKGELVA